MINELQKFFRKESINALLKCALFLTYIAMGSQSLVLKDVVIYVYLLITRPRPK